MRLVFDCGLGLICIGVLGGRVSAPSLRHVFLFL